jgi:NO-binding membrane sensor protein with MHYT domain
LAWPAMHYTGMAAMRMSATMTYSVPLLALSVIIAIVAFVLTATIALSPATLEIREDHEILDLARSRGLQV